MNIKFKRLFVMTLIISCFLCTVAYADYVTFAGDALARLEVERYGGSAKCIVGTYCGESHTYARYQLQTTYEDGSETITDSGIFKERVTNISNAYWENGVEDYSSAHSVYDSNGYQKGFVSMSE